MKPFVTLGGFPEATQCQGEHLLRLVCLESGGWYSVSIPHLVMSCQPPAFLCLSLSAQKFNSPALVSLFPGIRTGCTYQPCDVGREAEDHAAGYHPPGLLFLAS